MKPGPLTAAEWTTMRKHPEIGCEIVGNIDFLTNALPVIRHHHEHYDGNGYPDGLRADEIPILARIFAVVDSFDAQTNWRPYNIAHSTDAALENIRRISGTLYDPPRFFLAAAGSVAVFMISWRLFYVAEHRIIERML